MTDDLKFFPANNDRRCIKPSPADRQLFESANGAKAGYQGLDMLSPDPINAMCQPGSENVDNLISIGKTQPPRKNVFGTKEWSSVSVNCVNGCSHKCKYCFAQYDAVDRFHRITLEEWPIMRVRHHDVKKRHPKYSGTVMFPTTHDFTPEILDSCLIVLDNLLRAGNKVLIVTKPHLECISAICEGFVGYKQKILWRFTIGADDDEILKYWEPGAPSYDERVYSMEYAFESGFETSVSIEPMLDAPNVHRLIKSLSPLVTDAIWIGKLNGLSNRVKINSEIDLKAVAKIRENQSDDKIRAIYECLKNEPKIKWKESIKKVVGLNVSTEAGADI